MGLLSRLFGGDKPEKDIARLAQGLDELLRAEREKWLAELPSYFAHLKELPDLVKYVEDPQPDNVADASCLTKAFQVTQVLTYAYRKEYCTKAELDELAMLLANQVFAGESSKGLQRMQYYEGVQSRCSGDFSRQVIVFAEDLGDTLATGHVATCLGDLLLGDAILFMWRNFGATSCAFGDKPAAEKWIKMVLDSLTRAEAKMRQTEG